jgi:hypothetical protein
MDDLQPGTIEVHGAGQVTFWGQGPDQEVYGLLDHGTVLVMGGRMGRWTPDGKRMKAVRVPGVGLRVRNVRRFTVRGNDVRVRVTAGRADAPPPPPDSAAATVAAPLNVVASGVFRFIVRSGSGIYTLDSGTEQQWKRGDGPVTVGREPALAPLRQPTPLT